MLHNVMRRQFVRRFLGLGGALAAGTAAAPAPAPAASHEAAGPAPGGLGRLFQARAGRRRRASSWDRSGRNADRVRIPPGETAVMADIAGAGVIRHVWVTIFSPDFGGPEPGPEPHYLRKLVLRAYWDGEENPSIETPIGDFFGVGHARVSNYASLPLNMVTGGQPERDQRAAMNCFFPMPFGDGARLTVENQGEKPIGALYFYVDYEEHETMPVDALRFHAWWRRENPADASADLSAESQDFQETNELVNLDGEKNYLILEAEGRGHYVGCNLSVDHINPIPGFGWFGEGDDFIWIDGEEKPSLIGTGTEDYFCAAWGYPGGFNPMPYHGISYTNGPTTGPAPYSGKWTMYRYHIEDPVMFSKSIKVSIEHGHANVHANDVSSVAYWYQTLPHKPFPALPPVEKRLPIGDADSLRKFFKTY